jgi:hypothetical protein
MVETTELTRCEVCGNHYERAFVVVRESETHVFDSFECAIHALAPVCGPLQLPGDRARRRGERFDLLLRALRGDGGCLRPPRSGLTTER